MRVHVFQHVPFEGLGSIQDWVDTKKATVTWTRFYENDPLPLLDEVDLLIALGGPMSVNDEATLPWLVQEKQFIAHAIKAGKPVLGICLGAQLIASAMGARVYSNLQKEIGWFDLYAKPAAADVLTFPQQMLVLHWHGETFDLPEGATHLARSVACENQAFQLGANVVGLQFHLEMLPENVKAIVENCGDELEEGVFIQTEGDILSKTEQTYMQTNALMSALLDYLSKTV